MIHVALQDRQLWKEFDALCNEMIITKIGRNLFPILEYAFKGLHEHVEYQIGVTMKLTSCQKLKYTAGKWDHLDVMEEVFQPNEVYMSKPKFGRELMQRGLKLDKLKLTNTKDAVAKSDQMIRVQSMRQYVPLLNIYEVVAGTVRLVGKFEFVETKFIAVTAYQSERVKQLKVLRNKFAQGFREGLRPQNAQKRPHSTSSTSPDSTIDSSTSSENSENFSDQKRPKTQLEEVASSIPFQQNFHNGFQNFFDPYYANYYYQNYPNNFQQSQNHILQTNQENLNFPPIQYDYTHLGYQWQTQ